MIWVILPTTFTGIYRTLFLKTAEYTFFFLSAHRTFTKIEYRLGHKTSFNKYQKNKILQVTLPDHNRITVEIISMRHLKDLHIFGNEAFHLSKQRMGKRSNHNKNFTSLIEWK